MKAQWGTLQKKQRKQVIMGWGQWEGIWKKTVYEDVTMRPMILYTSLKKIIETKLKR